MASILTDSRVAEFLFSTGTKRGTNWVDQLCFVAYGDPDVDGVTKLISDGLQEVGLIDECQYVLRRRTSADGKYERDMQISSSSERKWTPCRRIHSEPIAAKKVPRILRYMVPFANQYYGVGGDDVYTVFSNLQLLSEFIENSTKDELVALHNLREKILRNGDDKKLFSWLRTAAGDTPEEVHVRMLYLLAVLDCLYDEDMFPAAACSGRLIDWSYLR